MSSICSAQVSEVSFMIQYNETNCFYDCYIKIEEGSATNANSRVQFNSQYSLVVPANSTVNIEEEYMPLVGNVNYDGTQPTNWIISNSFYGSSSGLDVDLHGITPQIVPLSRYNDLFPGDSIKIFSVSIEGLSTCSDSIRLYNNGDDYPSSQTGGGGFENGITIGSPTQLWVGNILSTMAEAPEVPLPTIVANTDISIDISPEGPACQGPNTYNWEGPNGYTSSNEDVSVMNAIEADFGDYTLTITDDIGCADTITYTIQQGQSTALDEVSLEEVILTASFEHISVHADILDDGNLNSTFSIEYRLWGQTDYELGAESMRAFPEMVVDGNPLMENFHAGSAMFLQPNSKYELRLTLTDADGGTEVVDTMIMTKRFPFENPEANILYVSPGNGGGSGTQASPYLGIQAAVDNSAAGDVLLVASGTYAPFTMTTDGAEGNPIIIKSDVVHGAIIDGGNTSAGIITLGSFSDSLQYIIVDGFDIKNGKWGIDAQNTQHLTIRNNKITDVDFGIVNRRENGWEHNQYFTNNEIIGRTSWPQTNGEIPGERGIDIRGDNNVISYNTISDFGDGISTDGQPYKTSYSLDIHNNDINRVVDDLIEVDGVVSNTRVYANRAFNGRAGISLAPIFGGPAYVFRNVFFNMEYSTFKMNRSPAGLYLVHNSSANSGDGMSSPSGWQNTVVKNNIILSEEYCFQEYGLIAGSTDDWDYNAFKSLRDGTNFEPWFKWDNIKYNTVADLQSGTSIEAMGISILESDLVDVSIPTSFSTEAIPSDVDFSIAAGSSLIDGGTALDNINKGFASSTDVDMGAYEVGESIPQYGHSIVDICDRNSVTTMTWNGERNQGWYLPNNWTPCGIPNAMSDTYVPDVLTTFPFVNSSIEVKNLSVTGAGQMQLFGESTQLSLKGN